MRALPFLVLVMGLIAGCVTPEQSAPDPVDNGDGLDTVAPSGGGETLAERIDRIAD